MDNSTAKLKLFLPIITVSEANTSQHWTEKRKRVCSQKSEIFFALFNTKIEKPCKITLVRCGGRKMDYDNLISAFKYIRDAIAENINPGLAIGRADDDSSIEWNYEQDTKKKKGIMIIVH
jgi:hypothetical protein